MYATPPAKGVACVTILVSVANEIQLSVFHTILLYIDSFVSIISSITDYFFEGYLIQFIQLHMCMDNPPWTLN